MSLITNDLVIRIKNGYMANRDTIDGRWSKINENVLEILKKSGFIRSFTTQEEAGQKKLLIELLYNDLTPAVSGITQVSKPGRRIYKKSKEIKKVLGGIGIAVISTPKGLMTDSEARDAKLGGEVLFEIW